MDSDGSRDIGRTSDIIKVPDYPEAGRSKTMKHGADMALCPEAVSDLDIQEWVQVRYGFVPHPFWIRYCKELYLHIPSMTAEPRPAWHECPEDKRLPIKAALQRFGMLHDQPLIT